MHISRVDQRLKREDLNLEDGAVDLMNYEEDETRWNSISLEPHTLHSDNKKKKEKWLGPFKRSRNDTIGVIDIL